MKPTTEQILSALNEMIQSKTELKAEKVELGLVESMAKLSDDTENQMKQFDRIKGKPEELQKEFDKIEKERANLDGKTKRLFIDMSKVIQDIDKKAEELTKAKNKFETKSKELGVNPNDVDEFKYALSILTFSKQTVDKGYFLLNELRKITKAIK